MRRPSLTRRGKLLMVEGVLLYGLARALGIDELYALALAALLFPALAAAFVLVRRHRVVFARTVGPRRVFAGGSVSLTYTLRNDGTAPSPPLILDDAIPSSLAGDVHVALPSLHPGRRGSISVERACPARGRFAIGPAAARIEDPFGLAFVLRDAAPGSTVTVFPRIELLHESTPRDPRAGGGRSTVQRLATIGEEFYAIRDFQQGDDLRRIHWRSSARRGALQIRQDEVRPDPRATVALEPAMYDPDALEWAVSAAASIVWELARQGFGLRLATPGTRPAAARWGREAADPLLTSLATVRLGADEAMSTTARTLTARPGAGGLLFAIVPSMGPGSVRALATARASYEWAGAIIVDADSFAGTQGRGRAEADQEMAETQRMLSRAGWRTVTAGSTDRIGKVWLTLLDQRASRPRSSSLRSS